MNTVTYTAPSSWASYFINGDASGLEDDEQKAADAFLAWVDQGSPVDCEDAGFIHRPDSFHVYPFAGDCQTYTFLERNLSGCFDGLRGLEIRMTLEQALSASHAGDCEDDARHLASEGAICDQLDALGADNIRDGLRESGAWDAEELADDQANRQRAVWLAACDIKENHDQ